MKTRKTIDVADILEYVNHNLNRDNHSDEVKQGMCAVIERVLFETGNYNGFSCNEGSRSESNVTYAPSSNIINRCRSLERQRKENGGVR